MKLSEFILLGDALGFTRTAEWGIVDAEIRHAITSVAWPRGEAAFGIRPVRLGNGVVPIKALFLETLHAYGWQVEQLFSIPGEVGPGPVDAQRTLHDGLLLAEWETGNISSSHRALNKLAIGMKKTSAVGGVLVVPDSALAQYLTDRIGNVRELRPYFDVWTEWAARYGFAAIYAVTYDYTDDSLPLIPKGSDGRALEYRRRIVSMKLASSPPQAGD